MGGRFLQFLAIVVLVFVVIGVVFLGFWDIQPSRQVIEKVIPNDRLFHGQTVLD